MAKPITPEEIAAKKKEIFPDVVIETFNELIAINFKNGNSSFLLKDARNALVDKMDDAYRPEYLDIEDIYKEYGWDVEFEKPDYTESWPAKYNFKKKRKDK